MDPLTIGLLAGGAQAVGAIPGAIGNYYAKKAQLKALGKAQGAITDAYGNSQGALTNSYGRAQEYQQPYMNAGQVGLNRMMNGNFDVATPGEYKSSEQQPTYQAPEFNYQKSPGYDFQMQQGQQAALGSAAGRGAGLSGSTLKALTKYGTGLAAQDYGNEFNRYMQNRQQGFGEYQTGLGQYNNNRLFGAGQQQQDYLNRNQQATQSYGRAQDLGNYGQTAAGNLSNMANVYGTNMANMSTGYGNSLANLYGAQGQVNANYATGQGQLAGNTLGNMMNAGMQGYSMGNMMQSPQYLPASMNPNSNSFVGPRQQ